jgi:hypothetical protein
MPLAQQQSDWPKVGTLAEWSRILNISVITLTKRIKSKQLRAQRDLNGHYWVITKEAIHECFKIK